MKCVSLKKIWKKYDNGITAISDLSMDVDKGEFITIVGPSGCGKSTLLRIIAGIESVSQGELYFNGKMMNDVPPGDRNVTMAFQNSALIPHLNAQENIALGLNIKKLPKKIIQSKVERFSILLQIDRDLTRKPKELSGGQCQRVSLGRALICEPYLCLLDEPLSGLDVLLKRQLRAELKKFHKTLGNTMLMVTHDQEEAMALGTRVAVMNEGGIQQISEPENLYHFPSNLFVADFTGYLRINQFRCSVAFDSEGIFLACKSAKMEIPKNVFNLKSMEKYKDKEVIAGIRPEDFTVGREWGGKNFKCIAESVVRHDNDSYRLTSVFHGQSITAICKTEFLPQNGEVIYLSPDLRKIHLYAPDTEKRIELKF